jgi:hypothetical protein
MRSSSYYSAQYPSYLNLAYRLPSSTRRKPARRNAQSRKSRRRQSVAAERHFLNETKGLRKARHGAALVDSSKEITTLTTTPPQPSSTTSSQFSVAVTQDDLDFLEKHLREIGELGGRNDNKNPHTKIGAAKIHHETKSKRPVLWRDIGLKSRTTYVFREIEAASSFPQVFTLRVDPALLADQTNPADYMHRRIRDAMKKELGRNIAIAGVMEWRGRDGNELHVHGVVGGLTECDLERAKRALRDAGGDWRQGRGSGHQVDLRPIDDARGGIDGWASYCTKDVAATQAEIDQRRRALGEESSRSPRVDFASRDLQQTAKLSYQRDREEFLSGRMPYNHEFDRMPYAPADGCMPYSHS